ncbi:cutinase family protein [Rhodococcus sp. IEGM 1379]|uniref:cutinase family protein n=1 Tax=Rhodococcus sp. IEGM 1379 TaxID=3047086 RepID=UPI0024B64F5B|nr:cutinase family protein [Rhodococcus sp. IEGM 1379]MDI9914091.1 cutinase family protein [Rhodococcus sp. IEGM 1379]
MPQPGAIRFHLERIALVAMVLTVVSATFSSTPAVADSSGGDTATGSTSSIAGSSDDDGIDPNNYGAECPAILIVAVSGASDSTADRNPLTDTAVQGGSNWLTNVTVPTGAHFQDEPGTVGWMYVPYPSTYGVDLFDPVPTYQDSMAAGVESTHRLLEDNKVKCGDATKYVLLGYSVGSEVVERVARDIGHRDTTSLIGPDDIAGVMLVGDPYRPTGTPSLGQSGPAGGGFMSQEQADYGALASKVQSACRPYDIACDAPKNIAILQLTLGVLGQMHFTGADLGQTFVDFGNAVRTMAAKSIVYISTHPGWFDSDESFLDVALKTSDQTFDPDGPNSDIQLSNAEIVDTFKWAMGPGSDVVQAKLQAEGPGFIEDNSGLFELVTKPYIFLGFIQHILYWNNNPNDPWYWESERIVDWITTLARTQRVLDTAGH